MKLSSILTDASTTTKSMPRTARFSRLRRISSVLMPAPDQEYISKADAKAIAFKHAGVKEADAKRVKVTFDFDDGVAEYEVEFHADKFDYDYEIDAVSGKILKVEKDRDFEVTDMVFVRWFDAIVSFIRNLFK